MKGLLLRSALAGALTLACGFASSAQAALTPSLLSGGNRTTWAYLQIFFVAK